MAGDIGASLGAEGWSLSAQGTGGSLTVVVDEGGFRVEGTGGDLSMVMSSGSVGATLTINGYTVTDITGGGLNPPPTLSDVNESANEIAANAAPGAIVSGITWSHDLGDAPTYMLTDDAGARFTIDPVTGEISRTAYETLDASHDVTVRAEVDGTQETYAEATVTITRVSTVVPVITSNGGGATANLTITEGDTAVTTVVASGQPIEYSISGMDADDFAIDADTGVLTFVSARDYSSPTDSDTNNTYVVTVTASDGVRSDTQDITVTVTDGVLGTGSVPGTEVYVRGESATSVASGSAVTFADASGTYGTSLTGKDWWSLTHDGATEGYIFASRSSAFTGLAATYFLAMEVKPIDSGIDVGMNISSGPFPMMEFSGPSIVYGTGGVRADGASGQYTVWCEITDGVELENFYIHLGKNGDESPSGANALSGEAALIGAIWIEEKGANSAPTAVVA